MIKEEKIFEQLETKYRRQQSLISFRNKNNFYIKSDNNKKRNNSFLKKNYKTIDDFLKFNRNIKIISKKEIIVYNTPFEINTSKKIQGIPIKGNNIIQDISPFSSNIINNLKKTTNLSIINVSNNFGLIGFKNIGNSCYMNSVLQILFNTPGFLINLREYKNSSNYQQNHLIEALIELSYGQKQIGPLKKIKEEMSEIDYSYGQNVQKDSQKFGIDLIEQIIVSMKGETSSSDSDENYEDEIKEIGKIKYLNFLNNAKCDLTSFEKMFLLHESFMKFNGNKISKIGFENWLSINLTFPNNNRTCSIEDLLSMKYQKLENCFLNQNLTNIKGGNKYINFNDNFNYNNNYIYENEDEDEDEDYNDILNEHSFLKYIEFRFNQFINMMKIFWNKLFSKVNNYNKKENFSIRQIASLPKILIISINRAILGQQFHCNKLNFRKYLNLNDYLDKMVFQNDSNSGLYRLYAVNECFSLEKNLGHYLSYIEKEEGIWLKFDDKKISKETPKFKGNRYVVGLYYIRV